ncbi:MAG: CBS domain-containing protein [Algibacter sp.]|uniref:CBS domain-containing protein n=1 Tax=Algibacter sp. TaxID=1872428 RepID=UPI0026323736|nr:CBS domain-containing protein [Algibacter sp.]MDG1730635.1 CBS domain-containing protein [Algibacter sp.]MDG2177456.1 CBS domain-containing protein [Algibacter sp.]
MRTRIPVSTIMTKNIIAISPNEDLERAELLFKRHKIKHIPVVSHGVVVGLISYTDLMRISFAETGDEESTSVDSVVYNMFTIEQVMAKDVETVASDTSIKNVAQILADREFHALPIVDNGSLVGIVTTTDLLNYFIKHI